MHARARHLHMHVCTRAVHMHAHAHVVHVHVHVHGHGHGHGHGHLHGHVCVCMQAFASLPGKHAVLQETSAQHFPQAALHSVHGSTGDWETRAFFPRLGPAPPEV